MSPWIASLLYISGTVSVDPTPLAFTLTALGLSWAIFRAWLLDISPIASEIDVKTINDGVLVVDGTGRSYTSIPNLPSNSISTTV
ncbi:histidine kinase N-terminal 7TM domain-containing protein [Halocatena marina]|uniref:histidine kinase N-terminal 7TM domain-containing protein n=1 Tax=Halocatena marina TaxID=2934937 RepID=UPI003613D767